MKVGIILEQTLSEKNKFIVRNLFKALTLKSNNVQRLQEINCVLSS